MKKQLEDFYFNIASEIARAELKAKAEAAARACDERRKNCLLPLRARAIAHGAEATERELEHVSECKYCARFVNNFRPTPLPAAAQLLAKLKRYCHAPEQVLRGWVETAFDKARGNQLARACAPEEMEKADPATFQQGVFSVELDPRRETGKFVVDIKSSDASLLGQTVTIVLIGEGGRERRVSVLLDQEGEGVCAGSAALDPPCDEVMAEFGHVIVPVVLMNDGRPAAL